MKKTIFRKCLMTGIGLCSALCLLLSFGAPNLAQAFEPGKTYDKSNYMEIEDLLIDPLKTYVKKGDYILNTGELDFRFWMGPFFEEESKQNEGKFDLAGDGFLIDKSTGKYPEEIRGYPFPTIDPKDPKAGQKIMENHENRRNRSATSESTGIVNWVGEAGYEREIIACGNYFYYFNRYMREHRVPNPNGMLKQDMTFVASPYDLRGTTSMGWHYQDSRESSAFAYLPMLRRVRRTSAASRSDPFMGSDACTDDADGYGGKNADMSWRLLEKKTILGGFTLTKAVKHPMGPGGETPRQFKSLKEMEGGWQIPGWQGAPWAPPRLTWCPREVYVLEMIPKDKYYNYGTQHYYVDTDAFMGYFKVAFAKSGEYWKCIQVFWSMAIVGDDYYSPNSDMYVQKDDKSNHATYNQVVPYPNRHSTYNLSPEKCGPQTFTISNVMQMSK